MLPFKTTLSKQETLEACDGINFYHHFDFDNGAIINGDWDISPDIADYGFPKSLEGYRVLDIGPASGWFSFYFEHLGADVTVVETRGYQDFDVYGTWTYNDPARVKTKPDMTLSNGEGIFLGPVSDSFWAAHRVIGSSVRFVNGRAYEVSPELFGSQEFDLVFMGALLQHLRDPIGALRAARSVCRGTLMASCITWPEQDESDYPLMGFPFAKDKITWWQPNKACYRHWFTGAGFANVDVERVLKYRPDKERSHEGHAVNREKAIRLAVATV